MRDQERKVEVRPGRSTCSRVERKEMQVNQGIAIARQEKHESPRGRAADSGSHRPWSMDQHIPRFSRGMIHGMIHPTFSALMARLHFILFIVLIHAKVGHEFPLPDSANLLHFDWNF